MHVFNKLEDIYLFLRQYDYCHGLISCVQKYPRKVELHILIQDLVQMLHIPPPPPPSYIKKINIVVSGQQRTSLAVGTLLNQRR